MGSQPTQQGRRKKQMQLELPSITWSLFFFSSGPCLKSLPVYAAAITTTTTKTLSLVWQCATVFSCSCLLEAAGLSLYREEFFRLT